MSQIIKPEENAAPANGGGEIWTPETFDNQQKGDGIMDQAKAKGRDMADKARNVAGQVEEKAENLYREGKQAAQHAYDQAGDAMQQCTDQAGRAMGAIRDYVRDQDLNHVVDEVSGVIRRHPLPAVLIGVGIGFLLARSARGQ